MLTCAAALHAQDKDQKNNNSISIDFASVPIMTTSGIDTSFQNALSVTPILDLRTKSGWGISYAPSFVTSGAHPGIYMHTVSAGYERYGEKNLNIAFGYNHFFFTGQTGVPYSPLNNEISFYLNYTHGALQPVLAASVGFGTDTSGGVSSAAHDIALVAGFNHHFTWENKGLFSSVELTPSILANIGTDGYFSFLSNSKYLSHSHQFINFVKKGKGSSGRRGRNNTASLPSFSLTNIEGNLEGEIEMGSFTARPSGSLFIPSNGSDNTIYGYAQLTIQFHF